MSRVAEVAVQTTHSPASKPGRAENRDPGGFSSLLGEDESAVAAEAAGEAATQSIKASEGGEPSSRPDHVSAHALMVTSLLAVPAADGAVADPAAVIDAALLPEAALEHASASNGLPGAIAAVIAAVSGAPDQAADGSADPEAASPDVAAAPDGANMLAAVVDAPAIVTPNADNNQQAPVQVRAAGSASPDAAQADVSLAAEASAAPAESASPDGGLPLPRELAATVASPNRSIAPARPEAAKVPLSTPADADIATPGKADVTVTSGPPAAALEQTQKPPAATDDGSQKDAAAKTDAAPPAPSDAKPAAAVTQPASTQAPPAQSATIPDGPAIAPVVTHAAQPALLQAQLIATPAAPDMPVPVDGLAIEITARAASGKSRFEIRLDPPELGRIDVRLDIDRHGRVGTHLVVEKVETLDMLRRDAPQLERALSDSGLKTNDSGLQFSLRDQSFAGRGDQNEGRQQSARLIVSDEDTVPASVAGRSYRMASAAGGLDIRV